MLKSEILNKLHQKHNNLGLDDIEIRGFGTLSRKINREKIVRNPKTNEKIFKKKSYKLHFKIGKILHKKINNLDNSVSKHEI